MSFITKLFGAAPTQAPAPAPATDPQVTNNLKDANSSNVPDPGAEPKQELSPAEKYKDVWDTPSEPTPKEESAITNEKMMEVASKVDFTRLIDAETMAKISAGGEDAMQALVHVVNKANQTSFGQSMIAAQRLIEAAVTEAKRDFASQVPTLVKSQQVKENLYEGNKALLDPSVAPIVDALQAKLAAKYPQATVKELNSMAEEMMTHAAKAFVPSAFKPKQVPGLPKDQSWKDLF